MSMRFRVLSLLIPCLVLLGPQLASADGVDRLIEQLEKSSDYKVRVSAALNLGRRGDQRALPALIDALRDDNKNVRGVAATSLSKLVDGSTKASLRKRALSSLERLAKSDPDGFVRKQAKGAAEQIRDKDSGGATPSGGIYVNIGPMSAKAKGAGQLTGLMRKTAEATFSKKASQMMTAWPSGKDPSAGALRKSKTTGYHVDGTLVTLDVAAKGGATLVSCKVSMLLATYPEKSMFGFLDGGARVQAGTSSRDIEYAQQDCVTAVVEDLIARKIIPVIQQRHP